MYVSELNIAIRYGWGESRKSKIYADYLDMRRRVNMIIDFRVLSAIYYSRVSNG